MNKQGNTYTFVYSAVLVIIVAALLSFVALGLQPRQNENIENEKRQNILTSIHIASDSKNSQIEFDKYIKKMFIINHKGERIEGDAFDVNLAKENKKPLEKRQLPVFVAEVNGETKYILPVYGKGLWGPIWGYISFNEDKNTIYGTLFDHKGETPGLGAEITKPDFSGQFDGKQIFEDGKLISVSVKKGGGASGNYEVDGISGGTITSRGVENMLKHYLSSYESFLKTKSDE